MADISISPLAPREFRVQVREADRETTHQVTVYLVPVSAYQS
jgi:hypothetical protein